MNYFRWALAELGVDSKVNLALLYREAVGGKFATPRAWNAYRLLLYSSRPESEVLLRRMESEHLVDGAVGEEWGICADYRALLLRVDR